jgi:hypothetical protein
MMPVPVVARPERLPLTLAGTLAGVTPTVAAFSAEKAMTVL